MQFRGEYAFLSNFYPSPIQLGDYTFPTAEHAFQTQKDPSQAHLFALRGENNKLPAYHSTPGQAKKAGRRLRLRPDWYRVRVAIMTEIVWAKFEQNPELRKRLVTIEDKTIAEDNTWGDYFWGRVHGKGENWLGIILMTLRSFYREVDSVTLRPVLNALPQGRMGACHQLLLPEDRLRTPCECHHLCTVPMGKIVQTDRFTGLMRLNDGTTALVQLHNDDWAPSPVTYCPYCGEKL